MTKFKEGAHVEVCRVRERMNWCRTIFDSQVAKKNVAKKIVSWCSKKRKKKSG